MQSQPIFSFINPGRLIEGDLELTLNECFPGDPSKNYVPAYRFVMKHAVTAEAMGNVELRVVDTHDLVMYGGHLAYNVEPIFRGHNLAARACKLLLPLAKAHGFKELWITCNPDNWASRRTCEKLGAILVEIVPLPEHNDQYERGEREKCRYRLAL